MDLKTYFDAAQGVGVLATADSDGVVDAAVFSRPHVLGEDSVAFILAERLTYRNLLVNPHAAYLFKDNTPDWNGVRLYLTSTEVVDDQEKINSFRRRCSCEECEEKVGRTSHMIIFHVDKVLPLIGAEE